LPAPGTGSRAIGVFPATPEGDLVMAQNDVVSEQIGDHREVEDLFRRLEAGNHTPEERRDLVDQVIMELVRHSVAEEAYLYPAVREHVAGGNALADKEIAEHAEAEETMKRLDGLDPADMGFEPALSQLMREIREHIRGEEDDLFPRLTAACSRDELDRLGHKVRVMKRIAPTRPHPSAPDKPPMNKLVGAPTGLVDRMRDALTGRGR
jgi:hemerythrin superfamily protein